MNKIELFEAIGSIDSSLIARCENERTYIRKTAWIRRSAIAACFCIVILCAITIPLNNHSTNPLTDPSHNNPPAVTENIIVVNELSEEPSFEIATINLNLSDFISMTDKELLNYYEVELNVPSLKLQPQDINKFNGVFKNKARGIYYDSHTFVFTSKDGLQRLEVLLGKETGYPPSIIDSDESNQALVQSKIDGMSVTIFSYTNFEGNRCYHTEFSANDVSYSITSYSLTQENFVAALTSIIVNNA